VTFLIAMLTIQTKNTLCTVLCYKMHHTADQFEHISKTTWARTIEILTASPAGPIRGYYDRVCLLFIYYY